MRIQSTSVEYTHRNRRNRGMALFVVLLVTLVLVILVTSMVAINLFSIDLTGAHRDRARALELAQAGLTQCLDNLGQNINYQGSFDSQDVTSDGYYECHFDTGTPFYSTNNLTNATTKQNYNAKTVYPGTADLVINVTVNRSRQRYHMVVRRGVGHNRALTCMGKVDLRGDCTLRGIKSLASNIEIPGSIHSNYQTTGGSDYAVAWDGQGEFKVNKGGLVSCVPGTNSSPVDPLIKDKLTNEQINEKYPEVSIPEVDILSTINTAKTSGYALPPGATAAGTGYTAAGQVDIADSCFIEGDFNVYGDINLNGGVLYVKGNLNVNGAIRGKGAIYVSGNTRFIGDTQITSNQTNGATIFCQKDVDMSGMDADVYLNMLAANDPEIATALANYRTCWNEVEQMAKNSSPTYNESHTLFVKMGHLSRVGHLDNSEIDSAKYSETELRENFLVLDGYEAPKPGARTPYCSNYDLLPELIEKIESTTSSVKDPLKSQRITTALKKMCYTLRTGIYSTPDANGDGKNEFHWDDGNLPPEQGSFDRQFRALQKKLGYLDTVFYMEGTDIDPGDLPSSYTEETFFSSIKDYIDTHPLDMSWLGNSYFQGVVYTKGKMKVSSGFKVIGVVLAKGDVSLHAGSELVYDEEYCNFFDGTPPIFRIVLWEEL